MILAGGKAISDLESTDRVLIGGDNKKKINSLINIYKKKNIFELFFKKIN